MNQNGVPKRAEASELTMNLQTVRCRDDFVRFIQDLARSIEEKPEDWTNADLVSFLNALAAWVADMDGYYRNLGQPVPDQPNWQTLGQMLLAARVYE